MIVIPRAVEQVCAREWARIGEPGTWWTGAERVAIAEQVRCARECALCAERKAALSPHAVEGGHAATPPVSAEVVDTVHRMTTDAARLTEAVVKGFPPGAPAYVETVGIVYTVTMMDTLARGSRSPFPSMPQPASGEPARVLPDGAEEGSAWVPTVSPERWQGRWGERARQAGTVANISRSLSLVPETSDGFLDVMAAAYARPEPVLSRPQTELIAAAVSAYNECFY